jgi:hypothetical protein
MKLHSAELRNLNFRLVLLESLNLESWDAWMMENCNLHAVLVGAIKLDKNVLLNLTLTKFWGYSSVQ